MVKPFWSNNDNLAIPPSLSDFSCTCFRSNNVRDFVIQLSGAFSPKGQSAIPDLGSFWVVPLRDHATEEDVATSKDSTSHLAHNQLLGHFVEYVFNIEVTH